jgi:hypothetical protein
MSNQSYGYDPFNPGPSDGRGFSLISENAADCYYNSGFFGNLGQMMAVFPDGTPYKQTLAELRDYIIYLEATRRLENVSNVNFSRSPQPGDMLAYNFTTGKWELIDYVSGGAW